MDGQHHSHGSLYAYSKAEWPEFYDLWVEQLFGTGPSEDSPVFWEALQMLLDSRPEGPPITVLDLGTGTGRVLKALVQNANDHQQLAGRVDLWGIDHSAAMIERAAKTFTPSSPFTPHFAVAAASDFLSKPDTNGLTGTVDLLIFAAGGVGHLVAEGEVEQFLGNVAGALRLGGSAMAIISVLNEVNEEERQTSGSENLEYGVPVTIPSRDSPSKIFRKTPTIVTWNKDKTVKTDTFTVIVLRKDEEGVGERVIKEEEMCWSLRVFDESKWRDDVERSGLEIAHKTSGKVQNWYFLKRRTDIT
jgi:SAM-dependent methyltransferase